MSNAAESRRRPKPSERLSQSVPDIEFDPNDNTYRHKPPSPSSSKRPPSRGVRRTHSGEGMKKTETTSLPAGGSDKKRPGRKKPSSLHDSNTHPMMSSSKSDLHASSSNDVSIKSSSGDKTTIKRKKKRPEDSSLHASKEGLSASRASSLHASKESLSASRSSLNASKESLSASRSSLNASKDQRRRRSTSRSKASSRRSTSRSKADSQHQTDHHHHRSSASSSRRDRSSSRDNHSKAASSLADKSRKSEKSSTSSLSQPAVRKSANSTMAVPVKTNSNHKLYDVDRPRQQSLKLKLADAQDDASVQSNQLLTKEQKAWKGIDDILDDDHESIATRDVLPEQIANAMHRDRQQQQQQQQQPQSRPNNNNAAAMPELMNSSFSSIRSEMTSLTLNTAMTAAKNYVVQEPISGGAADPMQAFLGSIAEQIISETAVENSHGSAAFPVVLNDTVAKRADDKNDTLRSRSTESSSGGSISIQEYYANSSSKLQHAPLDHANDDDEHDSENDDDRRYDPIVQAYGRATMPPKKSNNASGQSMVDHMPPLMDSSFSSLQSEMTDIQSIISTAKNFVVKDDKPPDEDDPMSAFLGRITNGLRARQMVVEEQGTFEDDVSGEHTAVILEDVDEENYETEDEQEYARNNHHIPAEDELSGAGPSIPDENDLSGAEPEDDDDDEGNYDEDIDEASGSEPDEVEENEEGIDPDEDDFEEPGHDVATYLPPNTPGGVTSIPSLSSVSTIGTNQETADPLAKWAANLREELAQKLAGGNALLTEEDEEMAEMEKALARAAEIAAEEKNETDITRVVLDEEVVQGVIEESQKQRAKAAGPPRKKKMVKKKGPAAGAAGETVPNGVRPANRPTPGRRKVLKKKKPPVKPLPAPAEEPEKFSAMFKEEGRPEQVARQKPSMPVAAVKAVAKATIPIPKQSKKEKYEQKSTLKSLKEKLQKLTFLRGKSNRRMSPATVGGDEGKYFPREHREEEEDEDASFL